MRFILSDIAFRRPGARRFAARCAIAVVSVTLWSGMPVAVRAQGYPVPQTNRQCPLPAPVGHRQPRAQDLPPDVLRDEDMARPAPGGRRSRSDGPFEGGDLRICRGC
jgi:hypothetical protein